MDEQERYVPDVGCPETAHEHFHRYAVGQAFAVENDVVDLGCGEGYGPHRLDVVARSVIGVDIDEKSVSQARKRYATPSLRFICANATKSGLPSASADLVVAFEIYEHLDDPDALVIEMRRLLRADGIALVSTPNRDVYSGARGYANPFHRQEATSTEFLASLRKQFKFVRLYGHRLIRLSALWPVTSDDACVYENDEIGRVPPLYFVAICSDRPVSLPKGVGLYLDPEDLLDVESTEIAAARRTIDDKDNEIAAARHAIQVKDSELAIARETIASKDAELARAREFTRNLEQRTSEARAENGVARDTIGRKDAEIELAKRTIALKDDELQRAREAVGSFEHDIAGLQADIVSARDALGRKDLEIEIARRTIQAKNDEIERARETMLSLESSAARRQEEETLRRSIDAIASSAAELSSKVVGLSARISAMEAVLDKVARPGIWMRRVAHHIKRFVWRRCDVIACVESPGGLVRRYGELTWTGWAFSPSGSITQISVRWAGRLIATAELGGSRPDVQAAHPSPYALNSGYRIRFGAHLIPRMARRVDLVADVGRRHARIGSVRMWRPVPFLRRAIESGRRTMDLARSYTRGRKLPRHPLKLGRLFVIAVRHWVRGVRRHDGIILHGGLDAYTEWLAAHELTPRRNFALRVEETTFTYRPLISVVVATHNVDETWLRKCLDSVLQQTYENWELCIADDNSSAPHVRTILQEYAQRLGGDRCQIEYLEKHHHISLAGNKAAGLASGEYLAFLDHDDELAPDALQVVVRHMQEDHGDIYYSDDDKLDENGRRFAPQFKPDWSPELLLSYAYMSHLVVVRRELFLHAGGFRQGFEGSQDYDLLLRLTEKTSKILHIPQVLYHWRAIPASTASSGDSKSYSIEAGRLAVSDALARRGLTGTVRQPAFAKSAGIGLFHIDFESVTQHSVSIIIPTRNGRRLRSCIESVEHLTTYSNYEIIIVDNGSDQPDVLSYLESSPHKVIRVSDGDGSFNFAHINNVAVEHANGEFILFLNDDTEVINGSWLTAMAGVLQDSDVGVVGAKLLYPDGRVQHAGVLIGGGHKGLARHAFRLIDRNDGGYLSYALALRNYSAVTAACMLTRRSLFRELGGFDEAHFAVAYNDVDYCLRVIHVGKRVAYQPDAVLIHHEGLTRGFHDNPDEEAAFEDLWVHNYQDTFYNENLRMDSDHFEIDPAHLLEPISTRPLRIVSVGHNMNFEGAPLFQFNLVSKLADMGWMCSVLSPRGGPLVSRYETGNVKVIVESAWPISAPNESALNRRLEEIGSGWVRSGVDIVHANTLECYWAVKAAKMAGLQCVWSVHESVDPLEYFMPLPSHLNRIALEALNVADRIVFVARATREVFSSVVGRPFRLITIPNGLDVARVEAYRSSHDRSSVRAGLGLRGERFVWLIVGTTTERKGQLIFVQAACQIIKQTDAPDCEFWIVGARECSYLEDIRSEIRRSEAPDRFKVVEETSDVLRYYAAADGFVCASFEESLPAVILEAFAFDLPVVATNVFGIPEMVRDQIDGLLVRPGDATALAEAMFQIMQDRGAAQKRAKSARGRLEKFCLPQMTSAYADLFQRVAECSFLDAPEPC